VRVTHSCSSFGSTIDDFLELVQNVKEEVAVEAPPLRSQTDNHNTGINRKVVLLGTIG
jgi:hypothetical protein